MFSVIFLTKEGFEMATIVQIYVPQWGSLEEITAAADYYKELGIDYVWISPCYPDGGADGGYDVIDYCAINPKYGTLNDMEHLINTYHENGIKVLMDLVINHCSDQNFLYKQALKAIKEYQDLFFMYDEPQNDWEAIFGGSAWKFEPSINKYVFHAFTEHQIDYNFDNPKVWDIFENIIRFWLEFMHVDGFRVDAQTHMAKGEWDLPPVKNDPGATYRCQPKLEGYMEKLADIIYGINQDAFLIGEANGIDAQDAADWIAKGLLDCVIQFEHLAPFKLNGSERGGTTIDFVLKMKEWSQVLGENNLAYIQSHDIACASSVLGLQHETLAKLQFSLNGHKLLYNGQETGMENKIFKSLDEIKEPETHQRFDALVKVGIPNIIAKAISLQLSRENARLPIQWGKDPQLVQLYRKLIANNKVGV